MANNKLFGDAASNIKSVDFTNSKIETFTPEAFGGCGELQKITFGETCKNIELSALDGCNNLQQIVFEGTSAPTVGKQDDSIMKNIIIEVPEGKEKDYQTALNVENPTAKVTAEEDILRYTSNSSMLSNQWLFNKTDGVAAKWSETEIPGEIIGKELWARFSWSKQRRGEPVSGTFDAQIENNEYKGGYSGMSGTDVFPSVGKNGELLVYPDKAHSSLLFTIQPYSKLSEKTEYTDNGYTYSFVNVEEPIYSKPTYKGEVVLRSDVTSVGHKAFYNDTTLITIKLPQQITTIKQSAFSACSGLTSINIPSNLTSISDNAFEGCKGLTSVVIPDSVTEIGVGAFLVCSKLTSINIPSNLTSISDNAFSGCSGLTSINIPNSVTSIGFNAFYSCTNLTSIDLPSSIETIEYHAFADCSGVSSVICRATTPPTLSTTKDNTWFSGLKTDTCHVPTESISQYESDANWFSQFKSFVAI